MGVCEEIIRSAMRDFRRLFRSRARLTDASWAHAASPAGGPKSTLPHRPSNEEGHVLLHCCAFAQGSGACDSHMSHSFAEVAVPSRHVMFADIAMTLGRTMLRREKKQ